jgi:hypothetical protein
MDLLPDPALDYRLTCDGSVQLTNRLVKARKESPCFTCERTIQPGETVRYESRRDPQDGNRITTRRLCAACCAAIRAGGQPWRHA